MICVGMSVMQKDSDGSHRVMMAQFLMPIFCGSSKQDMHTLQM